MTGAGETVPSYTGPSLSHNGRKKLPPKRIIASASERRTQSTRDKVPVRLIVMGASTRT
jgi:hypothetical protein